MMNRKEFYEYVKDNVKDDLPDHIRMEKSVLKKLQKIMD